MGSVEKTSECKRYGSPIMHRACQYGPGSDDLMGSNIEQRASDEFPGEGCCRVMARDAPLVMEATPVRPWTQSSAAICVIFTCVSRAGCSSFADS